MANGRGTKATSLGFLMLTDPATSPSRVEDQLLFGAGR
jgi:hypothetical protein